MTSEALINLAVKRLELRDVQPLRKGGQKYVARALQGDSRVVLKLIELAPPNAAVALERARREVGVLSRIQNDYVVSLASPLEELGEGPEGVAWLEEFLDGSDLTDRFGVPWAWQDAATMAANVASGLAAFHSLRVVHRDLSPNNVRSMKTGQYKLLDPGLARHIGRTSITGLWQPGTPGYLSPEHVSPTVKPTQVSDIFSLGILMYEALTGDVPVPVGGDIEDYARRLREEQAASIGVSRSDLSRDQCRIVDTCLQRQAARRYITVEEVLSSLEQS